LIKVTITEEFNTAWGEPGLPGNQIEIKHAVEKIIEGCNELFELEAEIYFLNPPQSFLKLKQLLEGCSVQIVSEINRLKDYIITIFQQPNPEGKFEIHLVFRDLPNIDAFNEEVEQLKRHQEEWIHEF
jgi:hypothetical protein